MRIITYYFLFVKCFCMICDNIFVRLEIGKNQQQYSRSVKKSAHYYLRSGSLSNIPAGYSAKSKINPSANIPVSLYFPVNVPTMHLFGLYVQYISGHHINRHITIINNPLRVSHIFCVSALRGSYQFYCSPVIMTDYSFIVHEAGQSITLLSSFVIISSFLSICFSLNIK